MINICSSKAPVTMTKPLFFPNITYKNIWLIIYSAQFYWNSLGEYPVGHCFAGFVIKHIVWGSDECENSVLYSFYL